uniref:Uncharacterized protein n=1 Tax=Musa acuminata subsp. malaccensis TaxID=214687 RepID=A0A804L6R2_MUSAM
MLWLSTLMGEVSRVVVKMAM